jgi:hypothetical protein
LESGCFAGWLNNPGSFGVPWCPRDFVEIAAGVGRIGMHCRSSGFLANGDLPASDIDRQTTARLGHREAGKTAAA